MHALEPYRNYKPSDAEWLGCVPEHWDARRLGNVSEMRVSSVDKHVEEHEYAVHLCNYVDVYKNDRIRSGMALMPATATAAEIRRFRLQSGDVLITKDSESWTDIGVPALVEGADDDVLTGYHLALLRPNFERLNGHYLFRALQCPVVGYQFHVRANGVTRYGLSHDAIKSVRLPIPPLSEQTAIVRFLDHADQRIYRYIRAKQKLIELLGEQKQATIHQAVTGQIDIRTGQPYPAYKHSRVEWLENVPEHWDVLRLGKLITLTVGFPFRSDGFTQTEEDMRLLRGVNLAPGRIRWDDVVCWPIADAEIYREYQLRVGDIVLGMDRPIIGDGIRVALVSQSDLPSLLVQRVARIRLAEELLRDFALLLLSGKCFSDYLAPIFTGVSVPHLSPEQIKGFRLALPGLSEQRAIIKHLTSCVGAIQKGIDHALSEISLLREYRTRLIADVVTGKLDVREAAAGLPEGDPLAAEDDLDDTAEATDQPAFDHEEEMVELGD